MTIDSGNAQEQSVQYCSGHTTDFRAQGGETLFSEVNFREFTGIKATNFVCTKKVKGQWLDGCNDVG